MNYVINVLVCLLMKEIHQVRSTDVISIRNIFRGIAEVEFIDSQNALKKMEIINSNLIKDEVKVNRGLTVDRVIELLRGKDYDMSSVIELVNNSAAYNANFKKLLQAYRDGDEKEHDRLSKIEKELDRIEIGIRKKLNVYVGCPCDNQKCEPLRLIRVKWIRVPLKSQKLLGRTKEKKKIYRGCPDYDKGWCKRYEQLTYKRKDYFEEKHKKIATERIEDDYTDDRKDEISG